MPFPAVSCVNLLQVFGYKLAKGCSQTPSGVAFCYILLYHRIEQLNMM